MSERLASIRERIRAAAEGAGRDPAEVRLVAVSKTVDVDRIREAVDAGVEILGENYFQEAREKIDALADTGVSWHFIGHLQSNKAKYVVRGFDLIHSVDRLKLARELDRQAEKVGRVQPILIQVNLAGEASKSGVSGDRLMDLVREVARLPHLSIQGLMTMPPFFDAPERVRPYFAELRRKRDEIREAGIEGVAMDELSMGMTGDFEAAVAEGATLVRIGTAIFGERA